MPVERLVLFLSSTAQDLKPFRDVVVHVAQRLGFEVLAMEEFGPDPRAAVELCRAKVESADVFVGLYAHRYGFTPEGFGGVAITELEYDWALTQQPPLPVLLFLVDEDMAWPPRWIEHGPGWEKLQALKDRLRAKHVVATLSTPERLQEELFLSLAPLRERRAPTAPAEARELPRPPEPYVVQRYSLLQTAQVVGRHADLDRLDAWIARPDAARMLCLVAIGGMGKSALTWKWFHEQAGRPSIAGRFWWSFYEDDASFERFVATALAYCGRLSTATVEAMPLRERELQLLDVLDRAPFLLVLDGFERQLIAYANLDFAHLTDEDLDQRTANTVGADGTVSQHRLRKTIDPRVGAFLRRLACVREGRVLLTTRLFPTDLLTVTGAPRPGVESWYLPGLTSDDAVALWRAIGVSGQDAELRALFARIDHYPLLIRGLAGAVANYRAAPGDFASWRRAHPDFDPFALPLVQAQSHVLAHALAGLGADSRTVLQTTAAFRAPVDYATLSALFVIRQSWTAQRLDGALSDLEDRGLLGWDRGGNAYDLHPIVRGVVWSGLDEVRQQAVYGALEEHFSAVPQRNERASTREEMQQAIELFTALVGLSRHVDAARLYFQRIHASDFSINGNSMSHINLAMLESLFPDGLDQRPRAGDDADSVIIQLSHAYAFAGRLSKAYALALSQLPDAPDYLVDMRRGFVAERAFKLGKVRESLEVLRLPRAQGDSWRGEHAVGEAEIGDSDRGLQLLAGESSSEYYDPRSFEMLIRILRGEFDHALALHDALADHRYYADGTGRAQALVGVGRTAEAIALLLRLLETARRNSDVEAEMDALLLLADAHRHLGDGPAARSFLDDLAEPAARGQYRMIQAKAALVLAELEHAEHHRAAAVAAATEAYRLAWCDGPPYTYYWTLKRAKELLAELGAPMP
jgi:tetratricopeptide (TPR) repeat protein